MGQQAARRRMDPPSRGGKARACDRAAGFRGPAARGLAAPAAVEASPRAWARGPAAVCGAWCGWGVLRMFRAIDAGELLPRVVDPDDTSRHRPADEMAHLVLFLTPEELVAAENLAARSGMSARVAGLRALAYGSPCWRPSSDRRNETGRRRTKARPCRPRPLDAGNPERCSAQDVGVGHARPATCAAAREQTRDSLDSIQSREGSGCSSTRLAAEGGLHSARVTSRDRDKPVFCSWRRCRERTGRLAPNSEPGEACSRRRV